MFNERQDGRDLLQFVQKWAEVKTRSTSQKWTSSELWHVWVLLAARMLIFSCYCYVVIQPGIKSGRTQRADSELSLQKGSLELGVKESLNENWITGALPQKTAALSSIQQVSVVLVSCVSVWLCLTCYGGRGEQEGRTEQESCRASAGGGRHVVNRQVGAVAVILAGGKHQS